MSDDEENKLQIKECNYCTEKMDISIEPHFVVRQFEKGAYKEPLFYCDTYCANKDQLGT